MVNSSPSAPEEHSLVLVGQVHLTQQNAVTGSSTQERSQHPQVRVRVVEAREFLLVHPGCLEHEGDGIHPKA
jgi:hypothetical protein